jgi:hypothetical protein
MNHDRSFFHRARIGEGAGAEMRRSLGTAVFSGMLGVTFFGVMLTPVFYYSIQWLFERGKEKKVLIPVEIKRLDGEEPITKDGI